MQNAKKGKTIDGPLTGLKHGGTINLSDGTSFTKRDLLNDPAKVMISIIRQQRTLYSKEVDNVLHARAQAYNPDYPIRTLLLDIYDDILDNDPFIHGLIYNHRILPVKNKVFKILEKDGKENPEKTKLLADKSWVDDYITYKLESKFYGHSLPYIKSLNFDGKTAFVDELTLIPRKHVLPERHIITKYQTEFEGTDYTADPVCKYVFPCGKDDDLGLLNKAAIPMILKRHAWQNWDEFGEIFGMPIRIAKTASQDPQVQAEIEDWLRDMSTASYGLFPMDTEIDVKGSSRSDAFKVFHEMIKAVNEELAILFVGQTMTSMNGSSKSQGEVHERVASEITKDDEKSIRIAMNEQVLPILRQYHGYPFDDGDYFIWDQPENLQNLLKIYTGINAMGFQTDPEEVSQRFGVKIIGLKQPAIAAEQPDDEQDPKDEQPKKKKLKEKPEDDAEELHIGAELIKLHGAIHKLYAGSNVHQV